MPRKRRPPDRLVADVTQAAIDAIEAGGIGALTARGLAGAVGLSVGTIYNHFGDLDGVVRAVNLTTLEEMEEALDAALDAAGQGREARLVALADAYLDFARSASARWQALFQYRFTAPGEDARIDAVEARMFAKLVAAGRGEGREDALRALWAAVHGVTELAVSRRLRGEADGMERDYARLIVRAGIRGIAELEREMAGG